VLGASNESKSKNTSLSSSDPESLVVDVATSLTRNLLLLDELPRDDDCDL
jgi:hypothetical protein